MPVVDQTLGYRLANPGARHIAAENRINQGGFPHSRLAENCEVEGTQGRECLGQFLLKHGLNLCLIQIRHFGTRIIGHHLTVPGPP